MANNFLEIDSLQVTYRQKGQQFPILDRVSMSLAEGNIGVLIGPSGCGKSTLLNVIAGLNTGYQGTVRIDGLPPEEFKDTALILQDYGLLPWKTVWENITLGLKFRKCARGEMKDKGQKIMKQLGLLGLEDRYPLQLSGGQRQRVAIARSLVLEPKLLLMDEPFSSLDALTREEMQHLLLEIWQDTRLTILMVTHNIEEAVFLGQEIMVMTPLPGTIKEKVENSLAGNGGNRGTYQSLELSNYLRQSLYGVTQNAANQ